MFWCGNYNQATKSRKYNAESSEINKCCRVHDECPLFIDNGFNRWGLANTIGIRTNWCGCDRDFMKCLRNLTSQTDTIGRSAPARAIGSLYFNVRRAPCFNINLDAIKNEEPKRFKMALNKYSSKDSINYNQLTGHYLPQNRIKTNAFYVEPPLFKVSPKQDMNVEQMEAAIWDKIIDTSKYQGEVVANTGPNGKKNKNKNKIHGKDNGEDDEGEE